MTRTFSFTYRYIPTDFTLNNENPHSIEYSLSITNQYNKLTNQYNKHTDSGTLVFASNKHTEH